MRPPLPFERRRLRDAPEGEGGSEIGANEHYSSLPGWRACVVAAVRAPQDVEIGGRTALVLSNVTPRAAIYRGVTGAPARSLPRHPKDVSVVISWAGGGAHKARRGDTMVGVSHDQSCSYRN